MFTTSDSFLFSLQMF